MNTTNVELILYLEPSKELKQKVNEYLNKKDFGWTTANKYDCHISMTGFFTLEQNRIQEIIAFLSNHNFRSIKEVPQINLDNSIIVYNNTPNHLLLSVKAPQIYHQLVESLSNIIPNIRLKRIDHISLAYWDEPEATLEQQNDWIKRVNNGLFDKMKKEADVYFNDIKSVNEWDVVLYQRVSKGVFVGQRHQFIELCRWSSST